MNADKFYNLNLRYIGKSKTYLPSEKTRNGRKARTRRGKKKRTHAHTPTRPFLFFFFILLISNILGAHISPNTPRALALTVQPQ